MTGEQLVTETYGAGVRRRLRDGTLTIGSVLFSGLLIFATYEAFRSTPLALAIAVICGIGSERVIGSISPIVGLDRFSKSERALWLALMGPVLVVLACALVYSVAVGHQGAELVGAVLVGWLFGSILSATHRVLAGQALG